MAFQPFLRAGKTTAHLTALTTPVNVGEVGIPRQGQLGLDGFLGRCRLTRGKEGTGQLTHQAGILLFIPRHVMPVGQQRLGIASPLAQTLLVRTTLDRVRLLGRKRLDLDQLAYQTNRIHPIPLGLGRAKRQTKGRNVTLTTGLQGGNALGSLIETGCSNPALNTTFFTLGTSTTFWTAETAGAAGFGVDFTHGISQSESSGTPKAVRLVRSAAGAIFSDSFE